jgi:hypothetical protein
LVKLANICPVMYESKPASCSYPSTYPVFGF